MRLLFVFGTRPEAIKVAPVIKILENDKEFISILGVTAQHREMLDQVLNLFEIKPDYDLDIMTDNQDLYDITSHTLSGIRDILHKERPDVVLVQGDTTTAFVAALAAFYAGIPVGHIEAGLRTGDLRAPFPEEANRALIGRLAAYHFPPTEESKKNLLRENVPQDKIFVTGNTIVDALLMIRDRVIKKDPQIWAKQLGSTLPVIKDPSRRLILVTGHRRENFGQGFLSICKALASIARKFREIEIIYPVHLNPNVRKPVMNLLGKYENIHLIDPIDYAPFIYLMNRSHIIITDSGGVQEEAPVLGKPVLVMREVTERPEGIAAGTAILVGTDPDRIFNEATKLLMDDKAYKKMSRAHSPYGDGKASQRIIEILRHYCRSAKVPGRFQPGSRI
ncbi:MAG: UDP-N-acetylglucosamine 2-epimerase (non-hydrolyzing) [bacterium]